MKRFKRARYAIPAVFLLCLPWLIAHEGGHLPLDPPWNALLPGIAIFGAAFILSWGAELSQFYIPQSLAIAFLALIAVLPEYAVDMYFAWTAGKDPAYVHFATANMTGANRLLIGVGWAAVVVASFLKSKKREVHLEPENRNELLGLSLATLYCFIIPFKQNISWIDSIVLFSLFGFYLYRAGHSRHADPEIEPPIVRLARLPTIPRFCVALFFFLFSGWTIFISAEPFAEGLLQSGRILGIEEFLLVQWLAPLASESPEFIVAILFALRNKPAAGLSTLLSSKVNQWTLLIGALPIVYNLSSGLIVPMPLDARQSEEILLTAAQSLFALAVIANLRFSLGEALLVFFLFASQLFFTSTESRTFYALGYVVLTGLWVIFKSENRRGFSAIFRSALQKRAP